MFDFIETLVVASVITVAASSKYGKKLVEPCAKIVDRGIDKAALYAQSKIEARAAKAKAKAEPKEVALEDDFDAMAEAIAAEEDC